MRYRPVGRVQTVAVETVQEHEARVGERREAAVAWLKEAIDASLAANQRIPGPKDAYKAIAAGISVEEYIGAVRAGTVFRTMNAGTTGTKRPFKRRASRSYYKTGSAGWGRSSKGTLSAASKARLKARKRRRSR